MAGSVTGLHVFAADVGPEPLSLLDGNFSPLATAVNTLSTYSNYYVDSGAVNALAITVNAPQVVSSYTDGLMVQVQVANTTTSTTPTLAINGLGARTLIHADGTALAIGELTAAMRFTAIYDSTSAEFRILSPTVTVLLAPTFNATVTINAVAGRQSLVVNGASAQTVATFNASGSPTGGVVLTATAGNFARYSAAGNGNVVGTGEMIFSQEADSSGLIFNRANAAINFGTNGTTNRMSLSASGNLTLAASASGTTVTINTTVQSALLLSGNGGSSFFEMTNTNASGRSIALNPQRTGVGNDGFEIYDVTAGAARLQVNATGNWVSPAPSSGTGWTFNSAAAGTGITATDGTVSATLAGFGGTQLNTGTTTNHAMTLGTNNAIRITISNAGNVSIATPTSGIAFLVTSAGNGIGAITLNGTAATADRIEIQASGSSFWYAGSAKGVISASLSNTDAALFSPGNFYVATSSNFDVSNATGTIRFQVSSGTTAPTVQGWGPTAAALVDMTPDKGSWTTTLSGPYTSNPSGTLKWERQGTQVTVWCDASITGTTTSANIITASGVPAAITPSSLRVVMGSFTNGFGANELSFVSVNTNNTFTIQLAVAATGANPQPIIPTNYPTANTCGIQTGWSITYSL